MRRLALAALVCLACGGSDAVQPQAQPQKVAPVTGCWLFTLTKPDGAELCSGAMNLIEKDGALSGGWNCETPEVTMGGFGGKIDGARLDDVILLDLAHEVAWGPWVVDLRLGEDGKSLTGEVHGGMTYQLTATLDAR